MKRILFWLVGVLAALCLVIGSAVAIYVGPDSLIKLPARTIDGGSPLLVIGDNLTRYAGTTLQVSASSDKGTVFVGAAHTIDATSYVGSARHRVIDQVAFGELVGRTVGDAKAPMAPDPAPLDIWTIKASGPGDQAVKVALAGQPVQVVVRTDVGSTMSLQLGATVPGVFALAISLAAVGLLGIVALVVLRRRGRRPTLSAFADPDSAEPALPPVGGSARELEASSAVVHRRSRTVRLVGLGVVSASMLSGCLAVPTAVPAPKAPVTKTALTQSDAARMMVDYDKRNNAALAALVKKPDPKVWDGVDSGPVLAEDRFDTAYARVKGEKREQLTMTHTAVRVHSPALPAYPMWAIVETTTASTSKKAPKDNKPVKGLHVFQRASARDVWTMHLGVKVDADPSSPTAGPPVAAAPADVSRGLHALKKVAAYYESGQASGLKPNASMVEQRKNLSATDDLVESVGITCRPYLTSDKPEQSVRVVRAAKGTLTMMTLQCQSSSVARDGGTLGWKDDFARALGTTTAKGRVLTISFLATVATETRGDAVHVLGAELATVRVPDLRLK